MIYIKFLLLFIVTFSFAKELITPIPTTIDYDLKKAMLGKKLFFDTRLSKDNTISCVSCHILDSGGDDNLAVSFGIGGQKGMRNSPTVLNARYNKFQFWDANVKTLQDQINGPIHNPVEMGSNFIEIVKKLQKDKYYKDSFNTIYKDTISAHYIIDAITEFEKALTTPNSRFDKYLRGDKNILTQNEISGYKLFKEYGCISCHNGINIGGNLLQKIGVLEKFDTNDLGLYNITKNENDKFYFKVPSLRNIAITSPYFHDGSVDSLEEAVDMMIKHQVGYLIEKKERDQIIEFLKTLTGETPLILKNNK